jgi:hypothetical protein
LKEKTSERNSRKPIALRIKMHGIYWIVFNSHFANSAANASKKSWEIILAPWLLK